jgi:hypothetical protein
MGVRLEGTWRLVVRSKVRVVWQKRNGLIGTRLISGFISISDFFYPLSSNGNSGVKIEGVEDGIS